MPNGDREPEWQMYNYFTGNELNRSEESEQIYRKEWKEIMDYLYNYPCIGVWVPFNERWGQFKTEDIATWTKKYDPSRLRTRQVAAITSLAVIFLTCIIIPIRHLTSTMPDVLPCWVNMAASAWH